MLFWASRTLLVFSYLISVNNPIIKNASIVLKSSYSASIADHLTYRDFLLGGLTFGSMYCSNFALKFVNYPFVVLSKSAKIMPGKDNCK